MHFIDGYLGEGQGGQEKTDLETWGDGDLLMERGRVETGLWEMKRPVVVSD